MGRSSQIRRPQRRGRRALARVHAGHASLFADAITHADEGIADEGIAGIVYLAAV